MPLKKLFDAYCERQGLAANSIRFQFDEKRLNPTQTPEQVSTRDVRLRSL